MLPRNRIASRGRKMGRHKPARGDTKVRTMLTYSNGQPLAMGAKTIRGRTLAHQHWTAPIRALTAADLVTGRLELVNITALQAAALCKVSQPYVSAAIRIADDIVVRRQIENGTRPLIEPRPREWALLRPTPTPLAAAWTAASPEERAKLATIVGIDALWTECLEPAIA
jgi:hypothetical protein